MLGVARGFVGISMRYSKEIEIPIRKEGCIVRALVGLLCLGACAVAAWIKAPDFDPYTMRYFTKTLVEPTGSMPREIRIIGGIVIGLGVLLGYGSLRGIAKGRGTARELAAVLCAVVLIVATGGAFFRAAQSAETHISLRSAD